MTTEGELRQWLQEREGQTLDFKESRFLEDPPKVAKIIVAFANTMGGRLVIGIRDDHSFEGMKANQAAITRVVTIARNNIDPPVSLNPEVISTPDGDVYVIEIPRYTSYPHAVKKDGAKLYFIRVGDRIEAPTSQELSQLFKSGTETTGDSSANVEQALLRIEAKRKQADELEGHLRDHYSQVLNAMKFWYEDNFPTQDPTSGPKVSYLVFPKGHPALGSVLYYSPPLKIEIHELGPRDYVKDSVDSVRSHLLGEQWERWQKLCEHVNGHLTRVEKLWKEITSDISKETEALGLKEWDGSLAFGKPLDYYWTYGLFLNVWLDSEYFAQTNAHRWDEERPIQRVDSYKNNAKVWSLFSGWVQSADSATLEKLKHWLTLESAKIADAQTGLNKDHASILEEFNSLHKGWRKIEFDYQGGLVRRLPLSCSRCRPLLDELASLGA